MNEESLSRGFTTVIVKLTAYCNLNCSYCYMFNLKDNSQTGLPKNLSLEAGRTLVQRLVEYHNSGHGNGKFTVVLHGGEPTLWPLDRFTSFFQSVEEARGEGLEIELTIQTNALLPFRHEMLDLFRAHGVSVGISVDGPEATNDVFRVDHAGRGSYERIMRNIDQLIADGYKSLVGGFLCVIDPMLQPAALLDWVATLPIKRIDFLWPIQFTIENPPWQLGSQRDYEADPLYGSWMVRAFNEWIARDDPSIHIRSFETTLGLMLGANHHTDSLVNDTVPLFAVDTDGRYCYPDYLRVAGDGAARTPFNVFEHAIEVLEHDPDFDDLLHLSSRLPDECQHCPHREVCGGGFLPGRVQLESPRVSEHRSVLCADEDVFFDAVRTRLDSELAGRSSTV